MNEQRVLGLIAKEPDQFHIAKRIVNEYDFESPVAQEIWSEMVKLDQKDISPAYIYLVRNLDDYSAEWLDAARESTFTHNVEPFCKLMLEDKRKSDFMRAIDQAPYEENPDEYLEKAIHKFRDVQSEKSLTFKQLIGVTADYLDRASEGETGILTGLRCLDKQMGGLQSGRTMVVAARTGVGKTALANQFSMNIASRGIGVGVCSLEMGDAELGIRSIAHTCQANMSQLFRAEDEALQKMFTMMKQNDLASWPIHFNTEEYELTAISNQIRLWVARDGVKVVVVDHIGLVEVKDAKSANERLGMVTRTMKKLSKDLDIPIILVSQLNRGNDKENRRPRLSDLRDSGSIEQDADMVLLMDIETDQMGNYASHKFNLAKNRQGPTGVLGAIISFDGATQTFTEQEYGY